MEKVRDFIRDKLAIYLGMLAILLPALKLSGPMLGEGILSEDKGLLEEKGYKVLDFVDCDYGMIPNSYKIEKDGEIFIYDKHTKEMSHKTFAEEGDMKNEEDKKRVREISEIRKKQAAEENKAAQKKEEERVKGLVDTFNKLGFTVVKADNTGYSLERSDSVFTADKEGATIKFSYKNFAK